MARGRVRKSPFLLSTLVFVAGMAATICLSYFFFERAEKDWNARVDQTAERLSSTLLAWLEESYAPVSGLVALVENSKTVEPNEFLNAFESMQSRSTTVLLDEASLVRLNRLGGWQVDITSDTLGYPGRYIQIADVAQTLSLAAKRPNQFTLSPPFKSERGQTISAIALSASAAPETAIVVGTLNYDTLLDGMRAGPVPKGIYPGLRGRFLGQPDVKSVVGSPNEREFQRTSTTRVASAGADIEISWTATREFDGGPSYGVALAGLLGGSGTTALFTLFIGSLLRRNQQIARKVDEATLALRQSSEALGRERERLQRILDASPVGVTITTNNIARFTNPRSEEMFALRVGSSVPDLYVYPEQRSALLDELSRKGIVRDFGVQFRGANGEIRDCLSTLMHMEYEGQQGLLGWIVDVTELTKIQTALSEAKVAAEDATRAKAEFLANMSHEIRTPMNAVIGLAHLCLKTDLTAKQRDYVGKIHNAGTSLLSIINDILDFSKIEAGKLDIENVAVEVDSLMNNISTMVAQKIQDKGLELLFDISSDIPPTLLGDPLRLGQVLINLLGNAVKFTETGEIHLIGELLEQTGNKVKLQFSVKDTGIGMTKEQANRLFQAFSQADTSTSRKYGGTGLGLAISKRLVELMGGSIWVVSEPGAGSTFSFTGWFGLSETTACKVVPTRLGSLKVLVVDDNAAARELLEDQLRSIGAEIEQVASGMEAIEAVKRADAGRPFDVLLLDWRMPGLDGVETARRLRADGSLKSLPAIIIVTAFGREEVRSEAELAGVNGFLVKPVNQSTLIDALTEIFAPEHITAVRKAVATTAYDLNGLRVLLAEDNAINQQIAVELLEGVGISVDVANNGREAVAKVLATAGDIPYDAVLMDLQMPEMDGYQATARIRAEPRLADLPIVAMTAHAMAEERDRCRAAGMRAHITKPIDPELLYRTLMQFHRPDRALAAPAKKVIRSSPPDVLPEIAGLDAADGLRRVAGNVKLYRSLLRQFVEQQADAVSEVRAGVERGDFVSAERLIHTLKGVSGNLGAKTTHGMATELERSLGNRDVRSLDAGLPALSAELARTIEAIRNALASDTADPRSRAVVPDSTKTVALLRHLKRLLADDDGAALDHLLDAREHVEGILSDADLNTLEKAVRDFDFTAALDCLAGIAQRHKFSLE
ncbi:response regulator [Bradyrhizobium erythrophlei]|uniref:Sensory/regulatory protein RpfC n=1 Tax=Bradyrhizobium erythrophlei TaxID=1437360 RepID=A0A1M5T1G5_9BRAD|nr:response regulator [Bradyrhizobium erythrophlei]SHH44518.1 two-component system, unclassified family, sensor histidine kinase and response regulator [Bradyrhizobium erythrophlei]